MNQTRALWRRIPRWVRWSLGLLAVSLLTFRIFVPPRAMHGLYRWTPECPELTAEAWRSRQDPAEFDFFGSGLEAWAYAHEELWSLGFLPSVVRRIPSWPNDAEALYPEDHLPIWNGPDLGVCWTTEQAIWLACEKSSTPGSYALWEIDRETGAEGRILELPLPPDCRVADSCGRIRETETGMWWLAADTLSAQGRGRGPVIGWQVHPESGYVSDPIVLIDRLATGALPDGTPGSVGILTEDGMVRNQPRQRPGLMLEVLDWPDPAQPPIMQSYERAEEKLTPPANRWPSSSPGDNGWMIAEGYRVADGAESLTLSLEFAFFTPLDQLRHQLYSLSGKHQALQPTRRLVGRALSTGQTTLSSTVRDTIRFRDLRLQLGTDPSVQLPTNVRQAVFATLDGMTPAWHRSWILQVPTIELWHLPDDTVLLGQVVRTDRTDSALVRGGLLRFGQIRPPSLDIEWLGYIPLPPEFSELREEVQVACFNEEDSWLIGLQATGTVDGALTLGASWTRVAHPSGWEHTTPGWLFSSRRLPPLRPLDSAASGGLGE